MFTYACSLSSSELLAGSILLTEVSEFTFSRAVSLEFLDQAECDLDSSLKLFETDLDMDNTSSSLLFDGECDPERRSPKIARQYARGLPPSIYLSNLSGKTS